MESARQVQLGVNCVSCGQTSYETLALLLGREGMPCRHCGNRADLTSPHYARLIQSLARACAATDAADSRTL